MQPRVKLVKQEDRKGCGVACVAMVTGKPYALVRKHAQLAGHWRPGYGMNGRMLQDLLDALHWTVLAKTFRFTRMYTQLAIVKVLADTPHLERADRTRKFQHYVVWCDGAVYDPGPGVVWRGTSKQPNIPGEPTGLDLYLSTLGHHARTGFWYWV